MALITLTDPGFTSVAPFGGAIPVLTSNPLAFGAPNASGLIHADLSTSMVAQRRRENRPFEQPWLPDSQGVSSTDPNVIFADPPGTVLPLGGLDAGHKGYGLGMMIELLSGCLPNHGRAEPKDGWSAAVFVLVIDPAAFGGTEAFIRQTAWLADACRAATPRPGFDRVRLPGEASQERRAQQQAEGVELALESRPACVPGSSASPFRCLPPTESASRYTVSTIFPRCRFSRICACAAAAWSSGKTRSIGSCNVPASTADHKSARIRRLISRTSAALRVRKVTPT
jgi:hypothetical protein